MSTNTYFEQIGAWPVSNGLARSYVWGYVLSLILTIASYEAVVHHVAPRALLIVIVLLLACVQFIVQLVFFLHLGRETVSRERLIVLGSALLIVFIIVVGSLWIMFSLAERMTPGPMQMQHYMNNEQGI